MNHPERLAIIGSGASAIYLLKHLLDEADLLKHRLGEISVFERSRITGTGMPYSPQTTDRYNMSNISSEELPELTVSFGDWLRAQEPAVLEELDLQNGEISDSGIYSRLALGRYLRSQYRTILTRLAGAGIQVHEHPHCDIADVRDHPADGMVSVVTEAGLSHKFDRVIIATGHRWAEEDRPESGYYASPWPIHKLLPEEGQYHNFAIGTLGASLSAFDVISSLAHRHGKFAKEEGGRMSFLPHAGTEGFKIIMHSSQGMLPHLQFDQDEPLREIYRHTSRREMLDLIDAGGFLRIDTYFDRICRPVLIKAFQGDGLTELAELLAGPAFGLSEFVEKMTDRHDYPNAFEGMRLEMAAARESVLQHRPVHWKEAVDDLMYTLNYHAELMPAEDHLALHSLVMPFLLNVVAAMPLDSGAALLALYDAGKLEMMAGRVELAEKQEPGITAVSVEEEERTSASLYRMFIDCSGQKPLELEDYPFPGLVKSGAARKERAFFENPANASGPPAEGKEEHLFQEGGQSLYHTGGVDIDGAFRLIGKDGKPNRRIQDIAFPHTSGVRPYSYGLQACSDTAAILVKAWAEEIRAASPVSGAPAAITGVYETVLSEAHRR